MTSLDTAAPTSVTHTRLLHALSWSVLWLALGALLVALAYQVPVRQEVSVGYNDAGYTQGFADASNRWGVVTDETGVATPYRWSRASSALLFPQVGLPARATIRVRGWRPEGEPPPRVRVLLNGVESVATFPASATWAEHTLSIGSGLLKPQDVFLQIEAEPVLGDGADVRGVQIDRAVIETSAWPVMPYPGQVAGGALATLLVAVLVRHRRWTFGLAGLLAVGFLLLYRMGVLPFAVRAYWLVVCGVLMTAIVARELAAPRTLAALSTRWRARVCDGGALAVIAAWGVVLLRAARAHTVVSLPGVEKDFRVFATRSDAWWCPAGTFDGTANCVWRADGFYQLGYPALLWMFRPLTADNPFLAAQVVAFLGGAILLAATYLLVRAVVGPLPALVALLVLALNRWTTSYSLFAGTDMPFAAAWAVALLALIVSRHRPWRVVLAGVACGLAFLLRHPGLVLVPLGVLWLWLEERSSTQRAVSRRWLRASTLFLAGFSVASLPQLAVNLADTGTLLYSQQAKNIWLAVYGNTDWSRWSEARDSVALRDVVLHDPGRFVANWWGNVRAFWGTGSEDTSEFGRSLGLRLLAFPANLLLVAGIVGWLWRGDSIRRWLLGVAAMYVAGIAVGFMLPRFALPLLPVAAFAAVDGLRAIWRHGMMRRSVARRYIVAAGCCAMLLLLLGSVRAGEREVLDNQDDDAVALVALLERALAPADRFVAYLPAEDFVAKYSAIAHRAVAATDAPAFAVYTEDAATAASPAGEPVGRAGRYRVYRIRP